MRTRERGAGRSSKDARDAARVGGAILRDWHDREREAIEAREQCGCRFPVRLRMYGGQWQCALCQRMIPLTPASGLARLS